MQNNQVLLFSDSWVIFFCVSIMWYWTDDARSKFRHFAFLGRKKKGKKWALRCICDNHVHLWKWEELFAEGHFMNYSYCPTFHWGWFVYTYCQPVIYNSNMNILIFHRGCYITLTLGWYRRAGSVGISLRPRSLLFGPRAGINMAEVRQVNKIPTIRGTDIIRDPRLNKVSYLCTQQLESYTTTNSKITLFFSLCLSRFFQEGRLSLSLECTINVFDTTSELFLLVAKSRAAQNSRQVAQLRN